MCLPLGIGYPLSNYKKEEDPWGELAYAVIRRWIKEGCEPMEKSWYESLCYISKLNPERLLAFIEYIYGPLIWIQEDYDGHVQRTGSK